MSGPSSTGATASRSSSRRRTDAVFRGDQQIEHGRVADLGELRFEPIERGEIRRRAVEQRPEPVAVDEPAPDPRRDRPSRLGGVVHRIEQHRGPAVVDECVEGAVDHRSGLADLEAHLHDPQGVQRRVLDGREGPAQVDGRRDGDMLQDGGIPRGIRIRELPPGQQLPNLLAQRGIGQGTRARGAEFGVRRQLRQHADQAVRNRLAARVGGGAHDVDDGIDSHALRGVQHEGVSLHQIAAHLHQTAQRLGAERADEARRAAA